MNISGTVFGATPFKSGSPKQTTGGSVDWTPTSSQFGNPVTLPLNIGNQVQWTPASNHFGTSLPGGTVTITVTGGGGGSTTTDSLGNYTVSGLTKNSQFVITPTLSGFVFMPPSRTITVGDSVNGIDFTAVQSGVGSQASPLQLASVNLSPAQILSLSTVPVTLVPAQGANTIISLLWWTVEAVSGTTPYTDLDGASFYIGWDGTLIGPSLPISDWQHVPPPSTINAPLAGYFACSLDSTDENQPLTLSMDVPVTGGDIVANVNVWYVVVPLV